MIGLMLAGAVLLTAAMSATAGYLIDRPVPARHRGFFCPGCRAYHDPAATHRRRWPR